MGTPGVHKTLSLGVLKDLLLLMSGFHPLLFLLILT